MTAMYGDVLRFWFPPGLADDLATHRAQWRRWMRGGVDADVVARFGPVTEAAARGALDAWAETPDGRLALVLVLDQFSRSLFRDTPRAYAQDSRALALALEGLANGHYEALATVWGKTFLAMPLVHAEGPDLPARAERNVQLADALIPQCAPPLRPMYEFAAAQSRRHRDVVREFGRHPHRNALLGRPSTAAEVDYLRRGEFPHRTPIED